MSRERIEIDSERLENALASRGLSRSEASRKLGYADNYMRQIMFRGFVTPSAEKMIDVVLGIPLGEYIPTVPHTETVKEEQYIPAGVNIDYEELQRCIYHAILGVVRKLQYEGVDIGEVTNL